MLILDVTIVSLSHFQALDYLKAHWPSTYGLVISNQTHVVLLVIALAMFAFAIFKAIQKPQVSEQINRLPLPVPPVSPQPPVSQKQDASSSVTQSGNVTQDNKPTFNIYGSAPPLPPSPAALPEEDELPQLEFVDASEIFLYPDHFWYGEIARGTHIGLVATFENPSKGKHSKNVDAEDVVGKLKFKNKSGKSLNVTSSWVGNGVQGMRIQAGLTQRLIVAFRDKPGTDICAVPCYNVHGPQRHSMRAYIRSLEQMKFPTPKEIMQDCSEIEIALIGNDDHTLFKHTFGFEVLADGKMNLKK